MPRRAAQAGADLGGESARGRQADALRKAPVIAVCQDSLKSILTALDRCRAWPEHPRFCPAAGCRNEKVVDPRDEREDAG